jgi:RNA polymerase sigma-70 factor (ECF subfamily)
MGVGPKEPESLAMDFSSAAFMQACRAGGREIESWLRALDREYGAVLYREAASILKSWQAAEDAVQEGMVKVWLRCQTFEGQAQPLTWIRQVIRRTVLDRLGAHPRETPLLDEEGELVPQAHAAVVQLSMASGSSPADQLSSAQIEAVFRDCFSRFEATHPQHAQVLRWVVEDGLDNRAIGELLERTPAATREYLSQCRKKARPYLLPWYALVKPS